MAMKGDHWRGDIGHEVEAGGATWVANGAG